MDKLARGFEKAESKPPCLTSGDAAGLAARVDTLVADASAALSIGLPNKCQATKLRATGKAASCLLRLRAKTASKDTPTDPSKVEACEGKLDATFAKAERKPTCGTTGDAPAILALLEAFVADADAQLTPSGGGWSLDSWTYKQVTASHEQTFGLAFGDVDQDGNLDVVSGPYWYANPGGDMLGTWTQSPAFPGGVHAMLAVDVDGDALTDLIAQSNSGADVHWLEATNAAGTAWASTPIGSLPPSSHGLGMQGARVAQIEAGGRPELLFSSGGGVFYFRIPGASPEAGGWPLVRVNANPSDEGFGVGDVDGDGDIDLTAGTGASKRVEWYRNPGTGAPDWEAFVLGDVSDFEYPDRFAVADMNGDSKADVVGTEENGLGSDAETAWWEQPADPTSPDWVRRPVATQGTTNSMDVADMDEDGDADVVTGEHRGALRVRIFENDGTGESFTAHQVDEGKESHEGAQVVDLDQDGDLDTVSIAYDAPGDVHLWRNDAAATVPFERVVVDGELTGYLDCKSVGDLDGDDLPDIVIGTDTELVWYEAPGWDRHTIAPGANFTTDMQVADVDGDGDLDVVVPEYNIQRIEWYRNPRIGGGTWEPVTIDDGARAHDLEVADMNGDSKVDVVIRGHFGPTTLYLQNTPASWYEAPADPRIGGDWVEHPIADPVDYVHTFKLADVDGDGSLDIAFAEMAQSEQKRVGFFRNGGGGQGWTLQVLSTDGSHNVRVADIGNDGDLDIVGANWQGPPVELFENLTNP